MKGEEEPWGLQPALGIWGMFIVIEPTIPAHGRRGLDGRQAWEGRVGGRMGGMQGRAGWEVR